MRITQGELYRNGVQLAYSKGLLQIPAKKSLKIYPAHLTYQSQKEQPPILNCT